MNAKCMTGRKQSQSEEKKEQGAGQLAETESEEVQDPAEREAGLMVKAAKQEEEECPFPCPMGRTRSSMPSHIHVCFFHEER